MTLSPFRESVRRPQASGRLFSLVLSCIVSVYATSAFADVSVSQSPLTKPPSIKPNIMLMLDDSGSMAWSVMPDNPSGSDRADYELISPDVNGVYYNPAITYDPPYTVTAQPTAISPTYTRYSAATFNKAWLDGFDSSSKTYDLSTYTGVGSSGPNAISNKKPAFSHTFQISTPAAYDKKDAICKDGTAVFSDPAHLGKCKIADSQTVNCPRGYSRSGGQCTNSATEDPDCSNGYVFNTKANSTTFQKCVKTRAPGCPGSYSREGDSGNWSNATCRKHGVNYDNLLQCANDDYDLDFDGLEPYNNDVNNLKYRQCYIARNYTCPSGTSLSGTQCVYPPIAGTCNAGYTYNNSTAMCEGFVYQDPICPDGYDRFGTGTATVSCRKTLAAATTTYRSYFVYALKNSDGSFTHHYVAAATEDTSQDSGSCGWSCALPNSSYPGAGICNNITQNDVTDLGTGVRYSGGVPAAQCHDDNATRQNVANWFSYYHSRILMAKSGLMNAFATLDTDIRFGFGSIDGNNDGNVPDPSTSGTPKMSKVKPFGDGTSGTRRQQFWKWVEGASANSGTPLRTALRAAGNYYRDDDQPWVSGDNAPECSGKTGTALSDCTAQQLSCRQSYTILTTDGFWNGDTITLNGSSYKIGGQDYSGDWDGGPSSSAPVKHTDPNDVQYVYKAVAPYAGGLASNSQSTLADIAMYYWLADLRPSLADTVPTNSDDPAFWQHMTTFTVGLFDQDTSIPYKRSDTGDSTSTTPEALFAWAKGGAAVPGFAWPQPSADSINNIGDLVHAGLNGRGGFYSAGNPDAFASGIRDALRRVSQNIGSGASLAANSTKLDTGTTTYQAIYYTGSWKGDLRAFPVNADGTISTNSSWVASDEMPAATDRLIKTCTGDCIGNGKMVSFTSSDSFDTKNELCADPANCLTDEATNKINYLRGDSSKEQSKGGSLRNRTTPLGDIIDSQPVFVGAPNANLYARKSFAGSYSSFTTSEIVRTRRKLLFVAANDGMLHAFNAEATDDGKDAGREMFAYLPKSVIKSGVKKISRPDYGESSNPHQYFNDGELTVADVQISGDWKTVLVGTSGRGPAKTIYALDITDPESITLLWERAAGDGQSNSNYIGQIVGKPVIARVTGGSWVAILGNGYNSSAGKPALLQFDIGTGALSVYTTTGSSNDGLAPPAVWISDATLTDNISTQAYAGDLNGNVWAFDLDADGGSGSQIFVAKNSSGGTQPITAGMVVTKNPADDSVWVFFGTGSVLATFGTSDGKQTWYGLIVQGDNKVSSSTTRSDLQQRTIAAETAASSGRLAARGFSVATDGDMSGKKGWYVDLVPPSGTAQGERMVTPNQFQGSLLIGTTRLPTGNTDPCNPSGSGWIMAIDPFTGSPPKVPFFDVNGDGKFTTDSSGDVATGTDGKVYVSAGVGFSSIANNPIFVGHTMLISFDNAKTGSVNTRGSVGQLKKVSWREMVN